jgi:uncharacterized protein (TIGR02594 family)
MELRESMFLEASKFYGLREIPGEQNNPIILGWFQDIGFSWVQDDETAWCSCFMNWIALRTGMERSGKLNARSWLDVGEKILEPELGDLVVLWREDPSSWKGHVGMYNGQDSEFIYVLGGNQGNMVKTSPYDQGRLLSYIRLRSLDMVV